MKTLKALLFCLSLISILGCEKNESEDLKNLEVEKYVEQLKNGEYESLDLPEFTFKDIPALLKYRNETQIISNYPINWISSMHGPSCRLGIYVLWTIESIRAVAIDSEYLIGRFPSQNPILSKRHADESELVYDDESHETAAKAYFDWWEKNKNKTFDEFNIIAPLLETEYRWH